MSKRPRYFFCWWCSRKLRGRSHVTMRSTASANENGSDVSVHRACSWQMEREGWVLTADAA